MGKLLSSGAFKTGVNLLVWVLVFQLSVPLHYASGTSTSSPTKILTGKSKQEFQPNIIRKSLKQAFADPFIEALQEKDAIRGVIELKPGDSSLDQDPFFLRSQSWVNLGAKNKIYDSPYFDKTKDGFEVYIPGVARAWKFKGDLSPIGFTDEYIFLSLNKDSKKFAVGQGVFLVQYQELQARAVDGAPVPVFFFPLPKSDHKRGWQGKLFFFEKANLNLVTIANSHAEVMPILLDDIERVVRVETVNLAMATSTATRIFAQEFKNRPKVKALRSRLSKLITKMKSKDLVEEYKAILTELSQMMGSKYLYPPRGSTAGFGMLYTGLDLDDLTRSEFADDKKKVTFWRKWSRRLLDKVIDFFMPRAHAQIPPHGFVDESMVGDDIKVKEEKKESSLANLGLRALQIIGVVIIASIVLRYTVFKKRYAKKHAEEDAKREKPPGIIRKGLREAKDVGEVSVHSVVAVSQLVSIHTGNIVEHSGDRLWPSLFAAENGLTRRFLNNTVYFVRDANERVPLSVKTWALGSGVFGATTTALYYVHLYHTVPWLAEIVGDHSPALQERIDDVYGTGSANVDSLRKNEVLRAGVGAVIGGAATLQLDFRNMYRNLYGPQVDEQMRTKGLDPNAVENLSIRHRLVQKKILQMEKEMGLPPPEDYLFGADTLYNGVRKILGNEAPSEEEIAKIKSKDGEVSYLAEKRPGLIYPSVKRALKEAKKYADRHPEDVGAVSAVQILKATLQDVQVLRNFLKAPGYALFHNAHQKGPLRERLRTATRSFLFYINQVRQCRKELVALTYQGIDSTEVENIPERWMKFNNAEGVQLAGKFFRQAVVSFMSGDDLAFGPSDKQRKKYRDIVEPYVRKALLEKYALETVDGVKTEEGRYRKLVERHYYEYKIMVDEQIVEAIRDQREMKSKSKSALPKFGPVARWQQRRAQRKANEKYLELHGEMFNPETASNQAKREWQNLFAFELMRKVGLHPFFEDNPELEKEVREGAEASTLSRLASDPQLMLEVSEQSPADSMLSLGTIYFQNFVAEYVNKVVHGGKVSALSPAQPGRLQRLRQWSPVKNSRALTRLCRGVESILTNEVYRPGLGGMMDRNLPFWGDFKNANQRVARYVINSGTVQYQFDKLLWRIHLSPAMWTLNKLSAIMIVTPWQAVNRGFRMQGFQPMGKVRTMFMYAVTASMTTIGVIFLAQVFSNDFQRLWDTLADKLDGFKNWVLRRDSDSPNPESIPKEPESLDFFPNHVNFTHN